MSASYRLRRRLCGIALEYAEHFQSKGRQG